MTDDGLDKLMQNMRDAAPELAKAKADRLYLSEFRKSKKAILFANAPSECQTIADKESWAYQHPEYLEVLDGLKAAIEKETELQYRMKIAEYQIETWRTRQANNRTIDRSHR